MPFVLLGPSEPLLAAIAAIAVMALASGALHLDGLADTADALLAPDRARAEQARKDPAIGPGGAVALVLVLAAQVAALVEPRGRRSRARRGRVRRGRRPSRALVPVVLARLVRSRRPRRDGLGGWFSDRVGALDAVVAVVSGVAVVGRGSGGRRLGGPGRRGSRAASSSACSRAPRSRPGAASSTGTASGRASS